MVLNELTINNIKIVIDKKNVTIFIFNNTDPIDIFSIFNFFFLKNEMISLDFLIEDEKKNIINIKENHYKFQYFSLNNFLFYYNNRLLFLKNSSTNKEFAPKKIIGWQMQLREIFFFNYESLHLIKENINGYREQKTLKKQFYE